MDFKVITIIILLLLLLLLSLIYLFNQNDGKTLKNLTWLYGWLLLFIAFIGFGIIGGLYIRKKRQGSINKNYY